MKKLIYKLFFCFLIIVISYLGVRPIFIKGFFPMHDDTQPTRIFEMAKALQFGQFPVRLVPNLGYGYGYPLFNFYAPLPYYLGASFYLSGIDIIWATKLMIIIGFLLAGLTMFWLVQELLGSMAGVVSSVFYLYAPYHAVQIYVRGAIGELYAYGFLPLVLLGTIIVAKNQKTQNTRKGVLFGATGLAGVLLSHNILGMLTVMLFIVGFLICFVFSILKKRKDYFLKKILLIIILGIGLSAFFILPSIWEKNLTRVDQLTSGGSNFRDHFVTLGQLWTSPWGYGGSTLGSVDGLSFRIGKIHMLLGLLSLFISWYLYRKKRINSLQLSIVNFQLLIVSASIFFMLDYSKFLWEILPGFAYVQYPWRFLNFAAFSLSVLVSFSLFIFKNKKLQIVFTVAILLFTIGFNVRNFAVQYIRDVDQNEYLDSRNIRYKISRVSDEYLPRNLPIPKNEQETVKEAVLPNERLIVKERRETPTKKIYLLESANNQQIVANIAFFPGWHAEIDGKKTEIKETQGKIELDFPQGTHKLQLEFGNTPIRTFANTISIFSLFLLGYVSFGKQLIGKTGLFLKRLKR